MAYLRFKANSLWTAVIFHMSLNVFLQKVFAPLTSLNEFGAIPALVASAIAIYFWKKGKKEFGVPLAVAPAPLQSPVL